MKYCAKCKTDKENEEFNANTSKPGGSQNWCRTCTTEYCRAWYRLNRDKHCVYVGERKKRKVHTCKYCGKSEPEVSFYIKKDGSRHYRRFLCYGCDAEYKKLYPTSEEAKKRYKARSAANDAVKRKVPALRYKFLLAYSRSADRVHGRVNNLDADFIKDLIVNGCMYCGDTNGKMSIDRIDNSSGHTKDNVNPSCCRCNMFRRNMPYDAWLLVAPVMKVARERGLLDGWEFGNKNHSETTVKPEHLDVIANL